MTRQEIESEIVETLGQVPGFFATMPDSTLEHEWAEFKEFQLGDTELTTREKDLIGYAVAAAIHCPYCVYFHRAATAAAGTTEAQLEEAARVAADTVKYSTYLHALGADLEEFKRAVDQIGEHVGRLQREEEDAACEAA